MGEIANPLDENTRTTLGIVMPSVMLNDVWIVHSVEKESWLVAKGTFTSDLSLESTQSAIPAVLQLTKNTHAPRYRPARISRLESTNDPRLMKLCFFSRKDRIWQPVVKPYLQALDSKAKMEAILMKLQQPQTSFTAQFALSLVSSAELLQPASAQLRQHVSYEERWRILCEGVRLGLEEGSLKILIEEVPKGQQAKFWSARPKSSDLAAKLLPLRPARILLTEDYVVVSHIGKPTYPEVWTTVDYLLKKLDDQDRRLAQLWMKAEPPKSDAKGGYVEAKMLSARMAEKAAASFLRQLRFTVDDVSAQQLSQGKDWKTHDLLVQGKIPVDVKNARSPINGGDSYVEYTVPRFKLDRNSEHVRILGVLSPYLFAHEFTPEGVQRSTKAKGQRTNRLDIRVLGVTQLPTVRALESTFGTQVLHLRINTSSDDNSHAQARPVLPPWVFDYPDKFYKQVDTKLQKIRTLTDQQIPAGSLIAETGMKAPIAPFLAARRRPPDHWMTDLKVWEISFVDYLLSFEKLTLPIIFLAILSHFTRMINSHVTEEYAPLSYGRIVNWGGTPFGRRDPLNLVAGLCHNLSTVWEHRKAIGLHEFGYFEYQGLGILRGARSQKERLITLIAYCGGYIEGKGKCGYPDLVLGKDNISACSKCGHLICTTNLLSQQVAETD